MLHMMERVHKKGNAGLSLIELICAIAIFGFAMTGVCGAMVVSSKVYNSGSTEVDAQQQAQLIIDDISNIVIESRDVEWDRVNKKLRVYREDDDYVEIAWDEAKSELTYGKSNGASAPNDMELLASGVTLFQPVTNTFDDDRKIDIQIQLERERDKPFSGQFSIASRNGNMDEIEHNTVNEEIIFNIPRTIVLEPNETYDLLTFVKCTIGSPKVEWSFGNAKPSDVNTQLIQAGNSNRWTLAVGSDETAENIDIEMTAKAISDDGTLLGSKTGTTRVEIRRVNSIDPGADNGVTDNSPQPMKLDSGVKKSEAWKSGSKFYIPVKTLPKFIGTNLERDYNSQSDQDYVSPFSYDFRVVSGREGSLEAREQAAQVTIEENRVVITLKEDIEAGETLGVEVIAAHPYGKHVKKSSSKCEVTEFGEDGTPQKLAEWTEDYTNRATKNDLNGDVKRYKGGNIDTSSTELEKDADLWKLYAVTRPNPWEVPPYDGTPTMYRGNDSGFGKIANDGVAKIIRMRDITAHPYKDGDDSGWTEWFVMTSEWGGDAISVRPDVSYLFAPDRDYEYELWSFHIKAGYPTDYKSYENGINPDEIRDTGKSNVYIKDQFMRHTQWPFDIAYAGDSDTIAEEAVYLGTKDEPYTVDKDKTINMTPHTYADDDSKRLAWGYALDKQDGGSDGNNNRVEYVIEKLDDVTGNWVDAGGNCTAAGFQQSFFAHPGGTPNVTFKAAGDYRIRFATKGLCYADLEADGYPKYTGQGIHFDKTYSPDSVTQKGGEPGYFISEGAAAQAIESDVKSYMGGYEEGNFYFHVD